MQTRGVAQSQLLALLNHASHDLLGDRQNVLALPVLDQVKGVQRGSDVLHTDTGLAGDLHDGYFGLLRLYGLQNYICPV